MTQHSEAALRKIRRIGRLLNALERISPAIAGRVGFRIFCSPRRLPLREKDADTLAKAEKSHLLFENLRIATYTWPAAQPSGKTALLLHGWESNSGRWRQFIKGFNEAGFTVQAFDAPASGNSQGSMLNVLIFSRVLKTFVEQKGAPDIVVGHSLGAAAAVMSMSLMGAARPAGMVLMGVFAESTRVIRDFGRLTGANERVLRAIFQLIENKSGVSIESYSVAKKTGELRDVKGLVIHDKNDEVAPVEEGRLVASAWNADLVETSGLGHRLQDKSVVQAVVRFAQSV